MPLGFESGVTGALKNFTDENALELDFLMDEIETENAKEEEKNNLLLIS